MGRSFYVIFGYGVELSGCEIDERKGSEFALNHGYECIEDMIADEGLGGVFEMCDESGMLVSERGDETEYLMLISEYPWYSSDKYKSLTREDANNLIIKAMKKLVNYDEDVIRSWIEYIEDVEYA